MVQSIEHNQKKMTNIQDLIGNREERHQKIQLWSNLYESEYALRLAITAVDDYSEDLFLAKTDPNANYTHIVAESDYFEDFMEGWEYTLRHFIKEYKEAVQQHPKEEYLKKNKQIPSNETDHPKRYPIKLISYLRCHYCNLDFHDVKQRREHELEWHV
jgi:hypothetical protein